MFTINEILEATGGKIIRGKESVRVSGVSINSRTLKKRECFVAVKGERLDGHKFINAAINKGASAFIISRRIAVKTTIPTIMVADTVKALGDLAHFHRQRFDIPVVAITGSAGKTTTKDLTAHILGAKYKVLKAQKSENNHFGVPLTLLKLNSRHQLVVLELGTNKRGEIDYLSRMAKPSACMYTNIGPSHLEGLKDIEGVFREKMGMVKHLQSGGCVIFNNDDPKLSRLPSKLKVKHLISYSINKRSAYQARAVTLNKDRTSTFHIKKIKFTLKTASRHNVLNALAGIACARYFKLPDRKIKQRLESYTFKNARFHMKRTNGFLCIDDTYNANPVSFKSAIQTLDELPCLGRKFIVCADMLELGSQSRHQHSLMGKLISHSSIDYCLTFGKQAKVIAQTIKRSRTSLTNVHCPTIKDVNNRLKKYLRQGDCVLVKGSRGMKMERVVAELI